MIVVVVVVVVVVVAAAAAAAAVVVVVFAIVVVVVLMVVVVVMVVVVLPAIKRLSQVQLGGQSLSCKEQLWYISSPVNVSYGNDFDSFCRNEMSVSTKKTADI